jgi:hypothetical protein
LYKKNSFNNDFNNDLDYHDQKKNNKNYVKPFLEKKYTSKFENENLKDMKYLMNKNEINISDSEIKLEKKVLPKSLVLNNSILERKSSEGDKQNILVVIKNKLFESLILTIIIFFNIIILKSFGLFDIFNPNDKIDLFHIDYNFIFILYFCGTINYIASELFIINDFLDNPNDFKIIIIGFSIFSFFPYFILLFFVRSTVILFLVSNLVNIYFIFTSFDYLMSIDLRFTKIDSLINKEMFEI